MFMSFTNGKSSFPPADGEKHVMSCVWCDIVELLFFFGSVCVRVPFANLKYPRCLGLY